MGLMGESSPKVSVVIPAFNASRFIKEAIDSILSQSYQDFELLVVDDGSTDNTGTLLSSYAKHRKIRVISFGTNMGEAIATNVAITAARGEYIARLDADDVAMADRLFWQVDALDCNPEIFVVGAQASIIGAAQRIASEHSRTMLADGDIKSALLDGGGHFVTSTAMWRRMWFVERNIWWNNSLPSARDHRFWVDAMIAGAKFANLDRTLVEYRIHSANLSLDRESVRTATRATRALVLRSFYPMLADMKIAAVVSLLETQFFGTAHLSDTVALTNGLAILEEMLLHDQSEYGENRLMLKDFVRQWANTAVDRMRDLAI
jgi:glycosyltransferase involved in cell wall biosynthesis